MRPSRRNFLAGTSAVALVPAGASVTATVGRRQVEPVPARYVRLLPSAFAKAQAANRDYVVSLEPERLLHNFYLSAGLPAPRPVYGGWEAQGIAGHTLGHWLSACSLLIANTGDAAVRAKLDHALAEMARIQTAHGDGYCGGTTVERDGKTVDGKVVFEEIRAGKIWSGGFDLNGGWVPLYTWHKVHAGLLDAHTLAAHPRALPIALGVAGYLAGVLEPLDDEKMQRVLAAEHGGLNESYAETYALTGDRRWLRMAERIRHKAVIEPLVAQRDELAGLHANTQIPKLIGLARIHELTGDPGDATAARFFHRTVVDHHSYVIGGNSDREHFGPPDKLSKRLTEATCEACNSYNMLKLTRHLYAWDPKAEWFDFYERVQLNHILAHQNPATGRFVYFMPLSSGARRTFSSAQDSFWCCVGSGMESHAKHADSIFWNDAATLYVNLYIPCELDWPMRGLELSMTTELPEAGRTAIRVHRAPRARTGIALRIPSWTAAPTVSVNGERAAFASTNGYAVLHRRWRPGDEIVIDMPMAISAQATSDDANLVAFVRGPIVLAADLGSASEPFDGAAPALVLDGDPGKSVVETPAGPVVRDATGTTLALKPFAQQYDRRTAVYFPVFDRAAWRTAGPDYLAAQRRAREDARRTVDVLFMGEQQPEKDHALEPASTEVVNWNGRSARRVREGQRLVFKLKRLPGASVLRLTLWGGDVGRRATVQVDGAELAPIDRSGPGTDGFADIDVPIPSSGEQGRTEAVVTFSAVKGDELVYQAAMLSAASGTPPAVSA